MVIVVVCDILWFDGFKRTSTGNHHPNILSQIQGLFPSNADPPLKRSPSAWHTTVEALRRHDGRPCPIHCLDAVLQRLSCCRKDISNNAEWETVHGGYGHSSTFSFKVFFWLADCNFFSRLQHKQQFKTLPVLCYVFPKMCKLAAKDRTPASNDNASSTAAEHVTRILWHCWMSWYMLKSAKKC